MFVLDCSAALQGKGFMGLGSLGDRLLRLVANFENDAHLYDWGPGSTWALRDACAAAPRKAPAAARTRPRTPTAASHGRTPPAPPNRAS